MPEPIIAFIASDLHGKVSRYTRLFSEILTKRPAAVFIAGDILPHHNFQPSYPDFLDDFILEGFRKLKKTLGNAYPEIFMIAGNDDERANETAFIEAHMQGLWNYCHMRHIRWKHFEIIGCSYIPPSPFRLKDWERYDVSRFADPGCIHPLDGRFSVPPAEDIEFTFISDILDKLASGIDMSNCILLMHSPPYNSLLDRAALDGISVDHVPLDPHVGSIAVQRFLQKYQPMLSVHGHIHESSQLTGSWSQSFGRTLSVNASWNGPELALICLDLQNPADAERFLLK